MRRKIGCKFVQFMVVCLLFLSNMPFGIYQIHALEVENISEEVESPLDNVSAFLDADQPSHEEATSHEASEAESRENMQAETMLAPEAEVATDGPIAYETNAADTSNDELNAAVDPSQETKGEQETDVTPYSKTTSRMQYIEFGQTNQLEITDLEKEYLLFDIPLSAFDGYPHSVADTYISASGTHFSIDTGMAEVLKYLEITRATLDGSRVETGQYWSWNVKILENSDQALSFDMASSNQLGGLRLTDMVVKIYGKIDQLTYRDHIDYQTGLLGGTTDVTLWFNGGHILPDTSIPPYTFRAQSNTPQFAVPTGDVITEYVDTQGNVLAPEDQQTLYYSQPYTTQAKEIEGWTLVSSPDQPTVMWTGGPAVRVTYIYQRMWGKVPWIYDKNTQTVTLYHGDPADQGMAGLVEDAPWKLYHSEVTRIIFAETVILPENSAALFASLTDLMAIDGGENMDVSRVTTMHQMFSGCVQLASLDVSNWDTRQVTNFSQMFSNAMSLEHLVVGGWVTQRATNFSSMFSSARLLTSLDVSQWQTENVEQMNMMFSGTWDLSDLDVSGWRTDKVQTMVSMFANARSITTLDLSQWRTPQLTNMNHMFNDMRKLEVLDISNFDTTRISAGNLTNVFSLCNGLQRLTLGPNSIFGEQVNLPAIPASDAFSGRWVLEDSVDDPMGRIAFADSATFMRLYNGNDPGTYVREPYSQEVLRAALDPLSDQSVKISGSMTEMVDTGEIRYENTQGVSVRLSVDDARIQWGEYLDRDQRIRAFEILLAANERLETDSDVTIFLSKPSGDTTGDLLYEQTAIKGIDYAAYATTLDRDTLNQLADQEALLALLVTESRATAKDVLTLADRTEEFRLVTTDLRIGEVEDGSYYAVLEVGNKAYQVTIRIDVTSHLTHLRVTVPTRMIFESIYDDAGENRAFESQSYQIYNHSSMAVDTYLNQFSIEDEASIQLLREGEDPLDYATGESPDFEDILVPLLQLNLKTNASEQQVDSRMEEHRIAQIDAYAGEAVSLTGRFYGPYPRWVQGQTESEGYYEDAYLPKYQLILRFVPRPAS